MDVESPPGKIMMNLNGSTIGTIALFLLLPGFLVYQYTTGG